MDNTGQDGVENTRIQNILDRYLASRKVLKSSAAETSFHLDEDSLAAFAEGSLSRRETPPVLEHLVSCEFCLHKTAELVRLDLGLMGTIDAAPRADTAEPSKISAVLSDILSKIFGTSDGAVFAHQDDEDAKKAAEDDKEAK